MALIKIADGVNKLLPILQWASLVVQTLKYLPVMQETGLDPWVEKIPWKRAWQPTPILWPGEAHGQRSLAGYSPWGHKQSDATERLALALFFHSSNNDFPHQDKA